MGTYLDTKITSRTSITITLDNQAEISTALVGKQAWGLHLITALQDDLKRVTKNGRETHATLRCVPVYERNIGNEEVDEEARTAARGQSSVGKRLPRSLKGMNDLNLPTKLSRYRHRMNTSPQRKHRELHSHQECRQAETNRSLCANMRNSLWHAPQVAGLDLRTTFQIIYVYLHLSWD